MRNIRGVDRAAQERNTDFADAASIKKNFPFYRGKGKRNVPLAQLHKLASRKDKADYCRQWRNLTDAQQVVQKQRYQQEATIAKDGGRTFDAVRKELEGCGYAATWEVVDAATILPQERKRLYVAGIRRDVAAAPGEEGCAPFAFPRLPDLRRGVRDVLQSTSRDDEEDALSDGEVARLELSPRQLAKVRSQPYTRRHPEARFLSDPSRPAKTLQSSYASYMVGS